MKKFKVSQVNDVALIEIPYKRLKSWEFRVLLTSDVHIDNKACKRQLLKKHLDEAKNNGWPIIDNGDFFDCMGGKYDKRSNKADILPELQVPNYFDKLTDYGADFLRPYKDNIAIMGDGNHELAITARHEINLTSNLIDKLGGNIIHQKYTGWIIFRLFEPNKGAKSNKRTERFTMYRTHGNGGNSPVTKGVIQSARRQDMIDADIYISGHIHTDYLIQRPKWYIDYGYNVKIKTPLHKQIGTYKDSTMKTWEDMKGFAPPSIGGTWLVFKFDPAEKGVRVKFEDCE